MIEYGSRPLGTCSSCRSSRSSNIWLPLWPLILGIVNDASPSGGSGALPLLSSVSRLKCLDVRSPLLSPRLPQSLLEHRLTMRRGCTRFRDGDEVCWRTSSRDGSGEGVSIFSKGSQAKKSRYCCVRIGFYQVVFLCDPACSAQDPAKSR